MSGAHEKKLDMTLHVWRQDGPGAEGRFVTYPLPGVDQHMSFLEMLDVLNETLLEKGDAPITFDHDCREGICGACGMVVNGVPHGPRRRTTTCQLHMREFADGPYELWVEPFRATAFPVQKDLMVDRSSLDRIIAAGGFISARTGSSPDANDVPVQKESSDLAMDAASCIGCGACVAACPNASASLFTAAKVSHLALLPQGQPERYRRVKAMVGRMDAEAFGGCTNHEECEAVCPKGISVSHIARMNRDLLKALLMQRDRVDPTAE
jgi:succinate dehydrogenase / fumarate reductase iron-sulfur subunit